MSDSCWMCKHYCQRSYLYTTGQKNVSGRPAWYQKWSKHRCNLKQEDRYPNQCDFEVDVKRQKELDEKYPDLVAAGIKIEAVSRKVDRIESEINGVLQENDEN